MRNALLSPRAKLFLLSEILRCQLREHTSSSLPSMLGARSSTAASLFSGPVPSRGWVPRPCTPTRQQQLFGPLVVNLPGTGASLGPS